MQYYCEAENISFRLRLHIFSLFWLRPQLQVLTYIFTFLMKKKRSKLYLK